MLFNLRRAFLVVLFSTIAAAGSLAWADHGHGGGGGGGGHGHGGGGGGSYSGGHGHVSYGHYGGGGFNNHWGGSSVRFNSGYRYGYPYRNYYNYYRPYSYAYFGYPFLYGSYGYPSSYYGYPSYYYSYPSDYFANGDDNYGGNVYGSNVYANVTPPQEYVVGKPVADVAHMEVRLPDPQATIWVEGKEMTSSGTLRRFKSPQLDPSQQFTYNVKAQWNDNGKLVTDDRKVKVQANALAVVDFTRPAQGANTQAPELPDLPPPQPNP